MTRIGFRDVKIIPMVFATILLFGLQSLAKEPIALNQEETAIRQASKEFADALRRGDAKSLAAKWTAEGTYTNVNGRTFNAQEKIEQHFSHPAAAGTSFPAEIESISTIRFIASDVAIEEGTCASSQDAHGSDGQYTAVWVKRDETWMLDSLSERASSLASNESLLEELSWMIGVWVGEVNEFTIVCNSKWSENKKFIVRHYHIEHAGKRVLSSTQRIGWDPSTHTIRSWVFDSDGSIIQGRWLREGDSWIVKTRGVLPDGSQTSSVKFWLLESENRSVLMSNHGMGRGSEGKADDEVKELVVVFRRVSATSD